jgi:MFS family permease
LAVGRSGLTRGFVALEHRAFRLLFLSTVTSGVGGQLQTTANLWQIYALTNSPLQVGLNGLARAIPIILFSLIGGVIADRIDRKKIIVFTQTANAVVALALGTLTLTGAVHVWHIYAATFLNATFMSASAPARRAVVASLVPRQHLVNAMALQSSVNQIQRIVAPSLAGVLIAAFGLPITYGVNGLVQIFTAVNLTHVPFGAVPERPEGSPLRNLLEGLAFVRMRSIILVLLATDAAAMLFGNYVAVLPVIAANFDVGPVGFGLLASAPALGGMVGTTLIMYLGDFNYKGRMITASILVFCGFLVLLGLAPWFWLALVAAVGLGLSDSMQATPRNAAIQLIAPDELRGRVSSFQQMLVNGVPSLGQSTLGAAAGALGVPVAVVSGALICAAINVGIFIQRSDLRAREMGTAADNVVATRGSSEPTAVTPGVS